MAKGYWIARLDVHDPDAYKGYVTAAGPLFRKFGAQFLVRGGDFETVEGGSRARNIVLEFDDYDDALACYHSTEYQEARAVRDPVSDSDLVIVEGYDGEQP